MTYCKEINRLIWLAREDGYEVKKPGIWGIKREYEVWLEKGDWQIRFAYISETKTYIFYKKPLCC